jgi:hypothetical protein
MVSSALVSGSSETENNNSSRSVKNVLERKVNLPLSENVSGPENIDENERNPEITSI